MTDGPKLIEPFWSKWPADARSTNLIYLLNPPEYSLYHFGQSRLDEARREGPAAVELKPWLDHQDRVAFYSLHFRGP